MTGIYYAPCDRHWDCPLMSTLAASSRMKRLRKLDNCRNETLCYKYIFFLFSVIHRETQWCHHRTAEGLVISFKDQEATGGGVSVVPRVGMYSMCDKIQSKTSGDGGGMSLSLSTAGNLNLMPHMIQYWVILMGRLGILVMVFFILFGHLEHEKLIITPRFITLCEVSPWKFAACSYVK